MGNLPIAWFLCQACVPLGTRPWRNPLEELALGNEESCEPPAYRLTIAAITVCPQEALYCPRIFSFPTPTPAPFLHAHFLLVPLWQAGRCEKYLLPQGSFIHSLFFSSPFTLLPTPCVHRGTSVDMFWSDNIHMYTYSLYPQLHISAAMLLLVLRIYKSRISSLHQSALNCLLLGIWLFNHGFFRDKKCRGPMEGPAWTNLMLKNYQKFYGKHILWETNFL